MIKLNIFKAFVIINILTLSFTQITQSQEISTIGEIYDYNVGDIFHKKNSGNYYGGGFIEYANVEILDKYYSTEGDILHYARTGAIYYSDPWNSYINFFDDTISFTNLDEPINNGSIDSIFFSSAYNGRKINHKTDYYYSQYKHSYNRWVDGCGHAKFYYIDAEPPLSWWEQDISLIYFLKGDEEWGNPYFIVDIEEHERENKYKIFPNPAQDYVNISSNQTNLRFKIFNSSGVPMLEGKITDEIEKVNISALKSGLYIIEISDIISTTHSKLIIQQRNK